MNKGHKNYCHILIAVRLTVAIAFALFSLPSLGEIHNFGPNTATVKPNKNANTFESLIKKNGNSTDLASEDLLPIAEVLQDQGGQQEEDGEKELTNYAYLGQYLKPWENIKGKRTISLNFENAELINLIKYFEKEYGVTFILDSVVQPMEGGKNPVGTKFSFKTEVPFNKKQAWDLFTTFLEMAGLKIIPGPVEKVYQITTNDPQSRFATAKDPIPTFIGIDPALLPESDFVRYVYFIQNATANVILKVADTLKSNSASRPILVEDLNALILSDKAGNIRSTLAVLKELDKPTLPESLTIIKLQKADALKVKDLYNQLVTEEKTLLQRLSPGGRKPSGVSLFTENVRVYADPRTNSLIVLGPRNNVQRIEDFIRKEVDKDIDLPYSPLHVYQLKFIDSDTTAQILTELKNFQPQSAMGATQFGGVIGGTKYLKPSVTITAEKSTNTLIINADYDDYLQIYDLIQKIDTEQPQVAIRVLVLDINTTDQRALGVQFRNRRPTMDNVLSKDVNFQTSGLPLGATSFSSLVTNPPAGSSATTPANGAFRLLGNLVDIASANVPGSTLVTLGDDRFGIWGLFKVLQTYLDASVISKPFIVTTHKYNAQISIEEVRRVSTANVVGGSNVETTSFGDLAAGLTLNITPQISPDGLVTLTVTVDDSQFTQVGGDTSNDDNPSQGNRNDKKITTSVIVENNQVLALGGLTRDNITEQEFKVPILGDIPLLGWMFKNKSTVTLKTNLLILISAEIINPRDRRTIQSFTDTQMTRTQDIMDRIRADEQPADPISRWFFGLNNTSLDCQLKRFDKPYEQPVQLPAEVTVEESKNIRRRRRERMAAQQKKKVGTKTVVEKYLDSPRGKTEPEPLGKTVVKITPPKELVEAKPVSQESAIPSIAEVINNKREQQPALEYSLHRVPPQKSRRLEEFIKDAPIGARS